MDGKKRTGVFGTTIDLAPDAEALPVTVVRGRAGTVRQLALLALLVAGVGGAVIAFVLSDGGLAAARVVVPLGLGLAGLAVVLAVIILARARVTWEFGEDEVRQVREGVLGRREWSEPLAAYRGVLQKQELRNAGKTTYMVYLVQLLKEGDKKHTVTLYQSLKKDDVRARHEHYARLFGMPALTETEEGIAERNAEDLDKTVRELVAEGGLQDEFDPTKAPPGKRLALRVDGEALAIQVKAGAAGVVRWVLPGGMAVSGLVMGVAGILPDPPVGLAYAGAGLVAGALGLAWVLNGLREELRVSPGEVRKWWTWRDKAFGERSVRGDEIEEVVIAEPLGSKGTKTVQAVSEDETVHFGRGLGTAERRWIRDCIIAVISR